MISDVNGAIYYHRNVYETLKAKPRSVRVRSVFGVPDFDRSL